MPHKQNIPYNFGTFFITFTSYNWLPLIEKTNGYDIVYNWFNHLSQKGNFINGFVIMPNHVHAIISFVNTGQSINTVIGNGKRFMAYEIVKRLKAANELELLNFMCDSVSIARKNKNKQHEVWEPSFDWKLCLSNEFIQQKLDYIHANPCAKKWLLVENMVDYLHSSAKYYQTSETGIYPVTNFMEMQDIDMERKGFI